MSRDVALKDGYLPLFAGPELIRKGDFTYPATGLIEFLLPPVVDCPSMVRFDGTQVAEPPDPSSLTIAGVSSLSSFMSDVGTLLPDNCAAVIDSLEQTLASFGTYPVYPNGNPVLGRVDSTDQYRVYPTNPALDASATFSVTGALNGVGTSYGTIQVGLSALGVRSINLSNLSSLPLTFGPGVLDRLLLQVVGLANANDAVWFPMFNMRFVPSPRVWVECLTGEHCAAP